MRVEDLPVLVGEQRRARAVQHTGAPAAERCCARGLDPDQPHVVVGDEVVEHADRVRAAADARDDGLRQPALDREHLLAGFAADHRCSSRTISGYGAGPTHEPIR